MISTPTPTASQLNAHFISGMYPRSDHSMPAARIDLRSRHRARHEPTGFGFVFADRIDFLDPVRWDVVTNGGSFFMRRDVLRVVEQHGPSNIEPRYAMIFRGNAPVAALAVQVVTVTGDHLRRNSAAAAAAPKAGLLRRMLAPAARTAGSQLKERMLVAGNLLSWGFHGIDPQALAEFERAQGQLGSALSRLLVVAERYPDRSQKPAANVDRGTTAGSGRTWRFDRMGHRRAWCPLAARSG